MVPATRLRQPLVSSATVSKRTRGTGRPVRHRPGARPPSARATSAQREARRPTDPVSLAAETEVEPPTSAAESSPDGSQAVDARSPSVGGAAVRPPSHSAHHRLRAKPGSLLAARADSEYVYVAQDLRRIGVVAAVLAAILIGLWVILVLMGGSPLY